MEPDHAYEPGDRIERTRDGAIGRVRVVNGKELLVDFERYGAKWVATRGVCYSPSLDEIKERAVAMKPWRSIS